MSLPRGTVSISVDVGESVFVGQEKSRGRPICLSDNPEALVLRCTVGAQNSVTRYRLTPHHPAWALLWSVAADIASSLSVDQARANNALSRNTPAVPALVTPVFAHEFDGRISAVRFGAGHPRVKKLIRHDLDWVHDCLHGHAELARSVASGYQATIRRLLTSKSICAGTFAVWPKDAGPLLMPKAELISFFDPSKDLVEALVGWGSVDGFVSSVGMWPHRFLAERYPSSDEISRMRNVDS